MPIVDVNGAERPSAVAILLHPHPAWGGDRFNPVVDALYRGLPPAGVSAVRFDFRSADPGEAAADVLAVLDQTPLRPVVLVGYSFGADVAATVIDGRLAGWFLVAPPLRLTDGQRSAFGMDPRPKGLAVPEHDQFSPPGVVAPRGGRVAQRHGRCGDRHRPLPARRVCRRGQPGDRLAAVSGHGGRRLSLSARRREGCSAIWALVPRGPGMALLEGRRGCNRGRRYWLDAAGEKFRDGWERT